MTSFAPGQQLRYSATATGLEQLIGEPTECSVDDEVLVVPNGYGLLGYTESVVSQVALQARRTTRAINLGGQGGSPGRLSIRQAADDLRSVIKQYYKDATEDSVDILVHCSSMLVLLDLCDDIEFWKPVRRIVLYGYLARPDKHMERFFRKCEGFGVRLAGQVNDTGGEFGPEDYARIPVPWSLIHPLIHENLIRASRGEVERLNVLGSPDRVSTPGYGYTISPDSQQATVARLVDEYILPHLFNIPPGNELAAT